MTIIGYTTSRDLTKLGGFLLMGLIGFLIGSVINLFFASSAFYWLLTFAGIAIFVGLTAWNTQRIKNMTLTALQQGDELAAQRIGIIGALSLYLDFVNLFLLLLRLGGRRR
jgi:FtsH-binding integral membrane protein